MHAADSLTLAADAPRSASLDQGLHHEQATIAAENPRRIEKRALHGHGRSGRGIWVPTLAD